MDVILIEPEIAGNVGAVARSMKNFACKNLVLVNPICDPDSEESRNRAKHANDVLDDTMIYNSIDDLKTSYDYLIGTTGKLGNDYNIKRSPLSPKQLAKKLGKLTSRSKVGIVFGRESQGLSNEELEKCDYTVSIPSNDKYPILNLSHAVTIFLYEIYQEKNSGKLLKQFTPINAKDKSIILEMIDEVLDGMNFLKGDNQKETQQKVWHQMIGKAMMTRREAFSIMGFFRKLLPKNSKNKEEE